MSAESPRPFAILLINACAVIAACYVFELTAVLARPRWYSNAMVNPLPAGVHAASFDRRSPMAVVATVRKTEGGSVYPLPTRPTLGEIFHAARDTAAPRPLAGVSRAPTVLCAESPAYHRYTSDRYGFNNADSVWEHPASIALIGDSFVQGNCVHPDSTIAAVLRRDGVRAVSLGVSGNGPLSELATMREFVPRSRARVAVWVFYEGNDLCDLDDELRDSMLARYLMRPRFTQQLADRQADVDHLLRAGYDTQLARLDAIYHGREWAVRSIVGLSQLRNVFAERFKPHERDESACTNVADLRRVLERARDDAALAGIELAFLYLPSSPLPNTPAHLRVRERRGAVIATARDIGLRTLDLTRELTSDGRADRVWSFPMSHYTPFGYAIVAKAIERELASTTF